MLYSTLTALTLTIIGTNVIAVPAPTPWNITDFSITSIDGQPTYYHLKITGEGETNVNCHHHTSVPSDVCADATGPVAFNTTACGGCRADTGFSWALVQTRSPLENGGPAFFVKFTYDGPASAHTLYGCGDLIMADDYTCVASPLSGEVLNVPASFVVMPKTSDLCLYA